MSDPGLTFFVQLVCWVVIAAICCLPTWAFWKYGRQYGVCVVLMPLLIMGVTGFFLIVIDTLVEGVPQ